MRTFPWLFPIVLTMFLGGAVIAQQSAPKPAAQPAPAKKAAPSGISAHSSVKEIMNSMIVPSSTVVFGSVATIADSTGTHEIQPRTEGEWTNVLHNAVILTEAANLLMTPGRQRELGGAIPEAKRAEWNEISHELVEAGNVARIAAQKHDVEGILHAGERIDVACDECHKHYQLIEGDPNEGKVFGTFKPGS